MKVALVCSALPGMGPRDVTKRVASRWRAARPADDVVEVATSEGETIAHLGTGLDDVVRLRHPQAKPTSSDADLPRRIRWTWEGGAFIDLADAMTWAGDGEPIGPTDFLGRDILDVKRQGTKRFHIHLPQLITRSDLGLGMLGELAGTPIDVCEKPRALSAELAKAQDALGMLSITLTYPAGMPLLGVNGMARMWDQAGMDGRTAQNFERHIGGWVHELNQASQNSPRRSLLGDDGADARAPSAGPGGGLGFMLGLLGARQLLIGDHLVGHSIPNDADLIVYVCAAMGMDLPSGLHAATRHAEQFGIPVVLLTDSAGMRKGELPRLGLHGSYELRPERAFAEEPEEIAAIARIPGLLDESISRIATTWGWDY
ncbi:glycerate kinase [Trueperella bonasi]|uniref:Glycerate kinase n=1 Tax=Trueperella bonasi TaxID=312286 RepID=A0ABT9NI68_9ACTO|nr:glycerate kinase [Trueperella bonasi]MDP9807101.1 glycerate kinase [Trueperella bonasi]